MSSTMALVATVLVVLVTLSSEKPGVLRGSIAILIPTLWYLIAATRPLGVWLDIFGVPLPAASGAAAEGSVIDRLFYSTLTAMGVLILSRRQLRWRKLISDNGWAVILILWVLLSITWSDYPGVSFKRSVKLVGSVVMALVVLSERDPLSALASIIRRCAYIHLPFSILTIRHFREIGVSWDWSGAGVSWIGTATSKNTLGQVALIAALYFLWELIRRSEVNRYFAGASLLMSIYLLKGSDDAVSVTSLAVFLFGLLVLINLGRYRAKPHILRLFLSSVLAGTFALLLLVVAHSVVMFSEHSLFGKIITKVGRDITLTDRTVIWQEVYSVAAGSEMKGVGFGGFWIGEDANIPFSFEKTWTLGQAHNGYVDTYLQLGLVGVGLLMAVLLSSFRDILSSFQSHFEFARLRGTLLLTIVFVNITETTFLRGDHHAWLLSLIVLISMQRVELSTTDENSISRQ